MSVTTVTTTKCDICQELIKPKDTRVFAGVYGYDFHLDCLKQVNGTILGMLTDELQVGISAEWEDRPGHAPRLYWDTAREVGKP